MQRKKAKRHYRIQIEYANGLSRWVNVKAADREKAEQRALKFHPTAIRVKV